MYEALIKDNVKCLLACNVLVYDYQSQNPSILGESLLLGWEVVYFFVNQLFWFSKRKYELLSHDLNIIKDFDILWAI